jgi:hypothetical protein
MAPRQPARGRRLLRPAQPGPLDPIVAAVFDITEGKPGVIRNISRYSSSDIEILGVKLGVILGVAGDCMSQAIGGFFGIVGMGLGIIIVSYGFEFRPRKKRF